MKSLLARYFGNHYGPANAAKDIFAGVIIALVSIPISMGYAAVAGIPEIYGLYGSLFPILLYGILTSTKNFVFGVDAAPAALVGAALLTLGIEYGSEKAIHTVPIITMLVAGWLLLFRVVRADRVVKYISDPVMGGFVTGICLTIIMMQIPKLYGAGAGTGEGNELLAHIVVTSESANRTALLLGLVSLVILIASSRLIPKFPMPVFVMAAGVILSLVYHIEEKGVKLLPKVASGFPSLQSFDFGIVPTTDLLFPSLSIAAVIMAETLLASKSVAAKDGYRLNTRSEVLAYSLANASAGIFGCCPVNGSVSRSSLSRQYGAKSQLMSVSASVVMLVILLNFTDVIGYFPVPMLTAIVISALFNACEFKLAIKLFKESRGEFYIFLSAMFGVLIFGTIYGVMTGILLSFAQVIRKAVMPGRAFLGIIEGHEGFYDLRRNEKARPIPGTVIYRFGGNLFFANIDKFEKEIEDAIEEDTKKVIVDAAAIGDVDVTAAERLVTFAEDLEKRGVMLYIAGHDEKLNDELRKFQATELMFHGNIKRTVREAIAANPNMNKK